MSRNSLEYVKAQHYVRARDVITNFCSETSSVFGISAKIFAMSQSIMSSIVVKVSLKFSDLRISYSHSLICFGLNLPLVRLWMKSYIGRTARSWYFKAIQIQVTPIKCKSSGRRQPLNDSKNKSISWTEWKKVQGDSSSIARTWIIQSII